MSRRFRWLRVLLVTTLLGMPLAAWAQAPLAELARARSAYNARNFDEAIAAATVARRAPETADAAAIVLGRAHLERYRERTDPSDLSAAREVLGTVRTMGLGERDQLELLLAFGEALFLEDEFGAAAELFESGIARAAFDRELTESMLEWWGSAVERQASAAAPDVRRRLFDRLAERMADELEHNPASAAASYWLVAGLRGAGDTQRAWDAAVAAWVRARLAGDRSPTLRADLDRLVLQGLIPDRVNLIAPDQRPKASSQYRADWELVKERWK
jgi:hypothetical protein